MLRESQPAEDPLSRKKRIWHEDLTTSEHNPSLDLKRGSFSMASENMKY